MERWTAGAAADARPRCRGRLVAARSDCPCRRARAQPPHKDKGDWAKKGGHSEMPAVLRLIPAAMSISISSLRQIVPSVPSNPSLLHCLQHTTHKIRRAVLNGREGRKGRGSGGVDRHQRPQVVARPATTASQEPLPSGRCRAAAAPPRAPQTTSAQPLRPRTAQPARTAVRRAGRRVAATLPRPLRAWRRSAIIASNDWRNDCDSFSMLPASQ